MVSYSCALDIDPASLVGPTVAPALTHVNRWNGQVITAKPRQ